METEVTLHLDKTLLEEAERFAKAHGLSVSQIVSYYLATLVAQPAQELTPLVRRLKGVWAGSPVDEADYHSYLEAKHR
jgi:hypothetical protein